MSDFEIRRIQQIQKFSLAVIIPARFVKELGWKKGDSISIMLTGDTLILKKVDFEKIKELKESDKHD